MARQSLSVRFDVKDGYKNEITHKSIIKAAFPKRRDTPRHYAHRPSSSSASCTYTNKAKNRVDVLRQCLILLLLLFFILCSKQASCEPMSLDLISPYHTHTLATQQKDTHLLYTLKPLQKRTIIRKHIHRLRLWSLCTLLRTASSCNRSRRRPWHGCR